MDPILLYQIMMSASIACLGLVIGSFLNVCIYRIPEGRTVVKGHSMCMSCGHDLGPLDLVPLFSWLFLRGRCRYCRAPIASRYAIIETTTAVVFGSLAWQRRGCFPIPYINEEFNCDVILLALLLFLTAVMIVCMMIWKDKGEVGLAFAVIPIVILVIRLGIAFLDHHTVVGEIISSSLALLVSIFLALLLAFLIPLEKKPIRDSFRDAFSGRTISAYFSGTKRGIFALDMVFISLCTVLGLPAAIPVLFLYGLFRFLHGWKAIRPYLGILMAAGGFLGVILFPF